MIGIATIEQIRAIEVAADTSGYSYDDMMDSAGRAIANRAHVILQDIPEPRITILVGAGNNGGDGLIAGLYIAQDNPDAQVSFYLLSDRDDSYIETAQAAELFIAKAADDSDKRVLRNMVASTDLAIDALFGIGVRLPIQGEAQKILRNVNRAINERRNARPEKVIINPAQPKQIPDLSPVYVLAVDCPSGLNCDTGEADHNIIPADETITFVAAKKGLLSGNSSNTVGQLTMADIGIPKKLDAVKAVTDILLDSEWVKERLPTRSGNSHKGTYGRALILAGSVNYIGAPALAAEAAYRSGAGLVTVGAPHSVILALSGQHREVTWMLLPHDMGVIAEGATTVVYKELTKMKALLVGPGLGTEKTTGEFLQNLLKPSDKTSKNSSKRRLGFGIDADGNNTKVDSSIATLPPLVIDADGLNLLAEIDEWWTLLPENTILTPHPGEMARLCDIETSEVQANRWELAREKAKDWNVVLVLKGAHTIIASANGEFAVLPFVTDALATAGTGDILAGLIVGLIAQGTEAFEAAGIAGYIHGLAGQIAGEKTSSRSVIAGDVLDYIGKAFYQIEARH